MFQFIIPLLLTKYFLLCSTAPADGVADISTSVENAARIWLKEYDSKASETYHKESVASWNWNTNITDYNQNLSVSTNMYVLANAKH